MENKVYGHMDVLPVKAIHGGCTTTCLNPRWSIVLAGGEGVRMRPLINHWLGEDRPKQYCTFVGTRSMLQHTTDRVRAVVAEEHIVTIIGPGHRKFLKEPGAAPIPGLVIEQPGNLGTAPGVFLPTAYVLANNPEATIALLPSDHYVYPEDQFCEHVAHAYELAEKHHDKVILVGAMPDRAETEYGWIDPGRNRTGARGALSRVPMKVSRFREKPDEKEAYALLGQGCLWNTMVMAVKAKTLWALGREYLSEMMHTFDAFLSILRTIHAGRMAPRYESSALASIYNDLEPADFSKDVLQHISARSLVLPMERVNWCDWGHPQRVVKTLAEVGRQPLFSSEYFGLTTETTIKTTERYKK